MKFEEAVQKIIDELPEEFAAKVENVEFVVEEGRSDQRLLAFYQGIPLKHRSSSWYSGALPDRIVIFKKAIEHEAGSSERVYEVLRRTIYHEIAHYFGISDARLRELGAY